MSLAVRPSSDRDSWRAAGSGTAPAVAAAGGTRPAGPPAARPQTALRVAIALWVVLGFALAVRTLYRPESHTVFPLFSAGSVRWWTDQPLYADYHPMDYFRYPPLFAIVITP